MMFLQRSCLLAATLGLLALLAPLSAAQQANSQSRSSKESANAADRRGHQADYCHDDNSKTRYYNGIYSRYGPPDAGGQLLLVVGPEVKDI